MVRQLYIILLVLHPARFRYRFAFEMLAIFDEASAHGSRLPLLADGVWSLVRQRVNPYRPSAAAAAPVGAGIPVFHSLETSLPRRRYLMTGATLSLVLFSALTTSIGRGGGRSSGILIGAFEAARRAIQVAWPTTEVEVRPAPPEGPGATALYRQFSFGVLDRDGDLMLSFSEIGAAPIALQTLGRDKDGSLSPPESYPLLAIFDQDRNGVISRVEISRSTAVLRGLDANRDGILVAEEAIGAVLEAHREQHHRDQDPPNQAVRL